VRVLPDTFTAKVVGMSFVDEYPANVQQLRNMGDVTFELRHNPLNEYDSNAVEVRLSDQMIGHLPRSAAARVVQDGNVWVARLVEVLEHPEHGNNPGLLIRCEREHDG
jgi:hypothetical protein